MSLYDAAPINTQIKLLAQREAAKVNVLKPCVVLAVNTGSGTVDVQPTDSFTHIVGDRMFTTPYPRLNEVPFVVPFSQSQGGVTVPITVGDTGYLLFADGPLNSFLTYGKSAPTYRFEDEKSRTHALTDAIFIPGLCWDGNNTPAYQTDGPELRNQDGSCKVHANSEQTEIVGKNAAAVFKTNNIKITVGTTTVEITNTGISIKATNGLTFDGGNNTMSIDATGIKLQGNLSVTGNVNTTGNITASGTVHGSNI